MSHTIAFRADAEVESALAALTGPGRPKSEVIRAAILAAYREHVYAQAEADSKAIMADPDERAEIEAVQSEMSQIRAW